MDENTRPLLLAGRIVDPDGSARQRYLLLRNGRVAWIGVSRPPRALAEGAHEIVAGPRSWIFPGLINLHTHSTYNVLPLWHSRKAPFNNRFEWRADDGYRRDISGTLRKVREVTGANRTLAVVSELQAIAGGTAILDQPSALDASTQVDERLFLCRNTGDASDIGLPKERRINSVVDFFAPENGRPVPARRGSRTVIEEYGADRDANRLGAIIVHLAEGRSGVGSGRGVDPYSRAEFEAFRQHPVLADAARVRSVPFTVVHGCGIDPANPAHVQFLVERDISIVWSPTSNLLLYGDTLDVDALIQSGVNVALGSDWSPSGSKHVWDEAKFARRFLQSVGAAVSDADVFRMVTANAGRCLGAGLGQIREGAFADLFIVESPIDSDSALEVFFSTEDRDVLATIINGVPIYGRRAFLQQFGLALQPFPRREGSAAADKAVHVPPSVEMTIETAVDAVEDALKALAPPVKRSNLLASSDKPYLRRMQKLRSQSEWFGWSARQTERRLVKGLPVADGTVPVPPSSIRVWCGFMAGDDRRRFLERLGAVLIPATVQVLRFLGLTAYFPAVLPADRPPTCPDDVALLAFESPRSYADTRGSVAGRTHALLYESLYRSGKDGSWSVFPEAFSGALRPRHAYYLLDAKIDWYGGRTRLLVVARDAGQQTAAAFHEALASACAELQRSPGAVDGALLAVDDDYFAFWDHRTAEPADDAHVALLERCGRTVMRRDAADANGNGQLFEPWSGFPLEGGECYRVTFERRALFPW